MGYDGDEIWNFPPSLLFRAWRDKNPYTAVKNDLNQFDPQLETHQILLPEKIPWVRKKNL